MSSISESSNQQFFTTDDVLDLMSELENSLNMMEPYYSQCNADNSAIELLNRLRQKQAEIGPFFASVDLPYHCTICNKSFEFTNKGKKLHHLSQKNAAVEHLAVIHNIKGKSRDDFIFVAQTVVQQFSNKQAFLDFIQSTKLK